MTPDTEMGADMATTGSTTFRMRKGIPLSSGGTGIGSYRLPQPAGLTCLSGGLDLGALSAFFRVVWWRGFE